VINLQDFQIILEESAFGEKEVTIKTKNRGTITGMFIAPDEFDSDPDRYGFQIKIGNHELDVIFLDEILEITESDTIPPLVKAAGFGRYDVKLVSGK